jgi:hypothetical protein
MKAIAPSKSWPASRAHPNADDTNALIALETAKKAHRTPTHFASGMRTLVENARKERAEALQHEGAEMVVLEGDGRVGWRARCGAAKEHAAIVLVPDLGGRRSEYTPYAQLLALDGFTTLAIDPRGHGDSRCDSLPSFVQLSADQRDKIPSDIATAQRYLRETLKIPASKIAVIAEGRSVRRCRARNARSEPRRHRRAPLAPSWIRWIATSRRRSSSARRGPRCSW